MRDLAIGGARFTGTTSITQFNGQPAREGQCWLYNNPAAAGFLGYTCTVAGIIGQDAELRHFGKVEPA
jgi:hypothetical protein